MNNRAPARQPGSELTGLGGPSGPKDTKDQGGPMGTPWGSFVFPIKTTPTNLVGLNSLRAFKSSKGEFGDGQEADDFVICLKLFGPHSCYVGLHWGQIINAMASWR